MSYRQIIYVSEPAATFTFGTLPQLLSDAQRRNVAAGVTGVLLCTNHRFAQCIEGAPETIDALYERIRRDERHQNVVLLQSILTTSRCFSAWSMGCAQVSDSEIRSLEIADWKNEVEAHRDRPWISPGFVVMEALWSTYQASDLGLALEGS